MITGTLVRGRLLRIDVPMYMLVCSSIQWHTLQCPYTTSNVHYMLSVLQLTPLVPSTVEPLYSGHHWDLPGCPV